MINLGNTLDFVNRFISRAKGLGYIVAVVFILLFIVNNGCNRQQIERLIEKTTGLNVQNDLLLEKNKRLDSLLNVNKKLLGITQFKKDSISKQIKDKENESRYWKSKYTKIASEVDNLPVDSSYSFTQSVYPFVGNKIYPYNALQVKGIHKTWLERKIQANEIEVLESSIFDYKDQIQLMQQEVALLKEDFALKSDQFSNTNKIVKNKDEEIKLLKKQLGRNSRWFTGFAVGPELGISYDVINQNSGITLGVGIHYNIYSW